MTKREAISRIKNSLKEVTADSRLSNKYIWSLISGKSSLLMHREGEALKLARIQNLYQTIPCLEMQETPSGDDCCGVRSYTTVYRSVYTIPDIYTDNYGPMIRMVTTPDGSSEIKLITPKEALRIQQDSFSKFDKTIYGFFKDGYIYLINKEYPLLSVEAIFKEDIRLRPTNLCSNEPPCIRYLDTDWIIPSKLEDVILTGIIEELINSYKKLPEDLNINKNNNT